jgi:hypothetical protein
MAAPRLSLVTAATNCGEKSHRGARGGTPMYTVYTVSRAPSPRGTTLARREFVILGAQHRAGNNQIHSGNTPQLYIHSPLLELSFVREVLNPILCKPKSP